jgi:hypothetical protein
MENAWITLIASLPTSQSGARMRLWRAVKAAGAVALRDGAYLLPDTPPCRETFSALAQHVRRCEGEAWLVKVEPLDTGGATAWWASFDRSSEYAALIDEARSAKLEELTLAQAARKMQALWRRHSQVVQTDHFPGEPQRVSAELLAKLQETLARRQNPDALPAGTTGATVVERLDAAAFRGRIWATRARPWVDGLASGWLIRRCIDPDARFRWLARPGDCRSAWIGFDFDGARFNDALGRVTFGALLASFGLDGDPTLRRISELVLFLEGGGSSVREASGIEAALTGLRDHLPDDDTLLDAACAVFDGVRKAMASAG